MQAEASGAQYAVSLFKKYKSVLILLLAAACISTNFLMWQRIDTNPTEWDDSLYIERSACVVDSFHDHGIRGFLRGVFSVDPGRGPLIYVIGALSMVVFGFNAFAPFIVHSLALIPLALGAWLLVKELAGKPISDAMTTWLCLLFFLLEPMVFFLMQYYFVEIYFCCCLIWTHLYALRVCKDKKWTDALLLGLFVSLSILCKITAPMYFVGWIFLYAFSIKSKEDFFALVKLSLAAMAVSLVIAAPYLYKNFAIIVATTKWLSSPEATAPYIHRSPLGWFLLWLNQPHTLAAFASVLLLGWMNWRKTLQIVAVFAIPAFIATYKGSQDFRFIFPALMVFYAYAIALFLMLEGRIMRYVQIAVAAFFTVFAIILFSFSWGWQLGNYDFFRGHHQPIKQVRTLTWANEEIVRDVDMLPGSKNVLIIGCETYFNPNLFGLLFHLQKSPSKIDYMPYYKSGLSKADVESFVAKGKYGVCIVLNSPAVPPFTGIYDQIAIDYIHRTPSWQKLPYSHTFPTGKTCDYFVNTNEIPFSKFYIDFDAYPAETTETLTFADGSKLRLLVNKDGRISGSFRFLTANPLKKKAVFIHALDSDGKSVKMLDQMVPETSRFFDSAFELPADAEGLGIGLYYLVGGGADIVEIQKAKSSIQPKDSIRWEGKCLTIPAFGKSLK